MRRINFAADRLSNVEMPGVQAMIRRVRERGELGPEEMVSTALDVIGPMEVSGQTREELVAMATQGGRLQWGEESRAGSEQRVADMLALIAASREYQFE